MYNGGGDLCSVKHSGGGSYTKQGRETTQAERIEIAKACIASGKNYGEIALKYQVSYQQARSWTLRFEKEGESGLEDRRGKRKKDQSPRNELEEAQIRIRQLEHELYLAQMERDMLKKLDEVERRYPRQRRSARHRPHTERYPAFRVLPGHMGHSCCSIQFACRVGNSSG